MTGVAHGSPAPARPPGPPVASPQSRTMPAQPPRAMAAPPSESFATEEAFDLEFEPSPSQATRQMSPEQAELLAALPDEELDEPVLADSPANSGQWSQPFDDYGDQQDASAAVDAQLDDASLGEDIDHEVAAELSGSDDMPFDPDEARAFDAAVNEDGEYITGYEETDLPRVGPGGGPLPTDTASFEEADVHAQGYDPYGTEAVQTPPYDPTAAHHVTVDPGSGSEIDEEIPVEISGAANGSSGANRAESHVEDELDEADFYIGQGMYAEALESLSALFQRDPNHPLVQAQLREVQALMTDTPASGTPHESHEHDHGTDAIDLDEMMPHDDDIEAIDPESHRPQKRKMSVMLERPVDESDAETHYDLGLAYKEMGLFDEAMKAFEKSLRAPTKEVQSRLMIGMCFREQGNGAEAIQQFKQSLHAAAINDAEQLSVYYEIGLTYEVLGEVGEAFYYFDMVTKRDPAFADAGRRADALRGRARSAPRRRDSRDEI